MLRGSGKVYVGGSDGLIHQGTRTVGHPGVIADGHPLGVPNSLTPVLDRRE